MTTNYILNLNQNNDETIDFNITEADPSDSGTPFNLTGYTANFYIKATATTSDASATIISGTITNATEGLVTVQIPAASLAASGALWWRLDVIGPGNTPRKTAGKGALNVQAA